MAAVVIAPGEVHLNAQMKTDAYTECRGVGRIASDYRPADDLDIANGTDVRVAA